MAVKFLSEEWAQAMTEALNSDEGFKQAAAGKSAKVQQVITTPEGEKKYYFILENGQATVNMGETEGVQATIGQDYDTAVALAKNELNGTAAFMSGRLKLISGDLMSLMQLQTVFNALPGAVSKVDVEY